jgi:hypothetical protein
MASATHANSRITPDRGRQAFMPTVRGDLTAALSDPAAFDAAAISAPRPVAWLVDRTLSRVPRIGPRDVALLEYLATIAVHADPLLTHVTGLRTASVRQASVALSGGGKPALPRDIATSLVTLFGGEPQRLTLKGELRFELPEWVADLLRPGGHYAYLDHAVLARFKTKAGPLLYRYVVGQLGAEQVRFKPNAAPFEIVVDPRDLAEQIGMPAFATFNPTLFRKAYLGPALADVAAHVPEFEIVGTREEKRLRAPGWSGDTTRDRIAAIVLSVRLRAPSDPRKFAVQKRSQRQLEAMSAHPDEPRFNVSTSTLLRLSSALPSEIHRRGGNLLGSEIHRLRHFWWAAIHEALTGEAMTPAYATRAYRGERLLAAIDRDGPDGSFWRFALEEADAPDLRPFLADKPRLAAEADMARRIRHKEHRAALTNAGRRSLRQARKEGLAEGPKTKRAPKVEVAMPEAIAAPELAHAQEPSAVDMNADLASLLRRPETKAEARKLFAHFQLGADFPDLHAARSVIEAIDRFTWGNDFPLLARVDELSGGGYMAMLLKVRDFHAKKRPYIHGDTLANLHAMSTRAWPTAIYNGQTTDLKGVVDRYHDACGSLVKRRWIEWEAAQKCRETMKRERYLPNVVSIDPGVHRNALGDVVRGTR